MICADSEENARRIASTHTYWKVQAFRHARRISLHPPDECLRLWEDLSPDVQDYYEETMATNMVVGTPDQCRTGLEKLTDQYGVEEVMVVNVCYHFEDRL